MPDELLVFEGARGARLAVCRAERLSREAALRHGLAPGSAAALAQALAGTLLVADSDGTEPGGRAGAKGGGIRWAGVDLHLRCPGPVQGLLTDADARGAVRGLVRVTNLARDENPVATGLDAAPSASTRFDPRPLLATRHDEVAGSLS